MNHDFIVSIVDTDALTINKRDGAPFTKDEITALTKEINSLTEELITWDFEFYVPRILCVRSKNYAIWDGSKLKIKGSSLRMSMKEPALKEFGEKLINLMVLSDDHEIQAPMLYKSYVHEIMSLTSMSRWCSKKTITDAVLNPERTNESKITTAIQDLDVSMGDRVRVYFRKDRSIGVEQNWNNDHDPYNLLEKLYKTVMVFENVIDVDKFPNYKLKRNRELLEALL